MARRRTLDRLLSSLGLCSRGTARRWIAAGRVSVDGRVVRRADAWVDLEAQRVELEGRPIEAERRTYLVLNKPKGYLTSLGDPRGGRTVYELLGDVPAWVFPVGRLDRDTSGLLLFTNDTELGESVTNPGSGLFKRYRATTKARVGEEELERLRRGVVLADGPTLPARAELVGHRGPTSVVELEIHEGRNRQVRRMFQAVGRPLKELRRVAIGPLELGGLPSGRWRELRSGELRALRAALDTPEAAVRSGKPAPPRRLSRATKPRRARRRR
jgi:23S rRNA pseudouridine2605 synthase